MPSFDIVSKYEVQEIENSVNMVTRDIANRYDFRGSSTHILFSKKEGIIKNHKRTSNMSNSPNNEAELNAFLPDGITRITSPDFISYVIATSVSIIDRQVKVFFGTEGHINITMEGY